MATIDDFCAEINAWTKYDDSVDTVKNWVAIAEQTINESLRHKEMITRVQTILQADNAVLPTNWLAFSYMRWLTSPPSNNSRVKDGSSLQYKTEDEYWRLTSDSNYAHPSAYTIIGDTIFFYPTPKVGTSKVEMAYYAKVPPLADGTNWLFEKYKGLYLSATLAAASLYYLEDARLATFAALTTNTIQAMNESTTTGQLSGAPISRRLKGFG